MRKVFVLILGTLFVCTLVGCGTDPNEKSVANTISCLTSTSDVIKQVTKTLNDGVSEAKKNNKPLAKDKVNKATEEAAKLKEWATALQNIKAEIEMRKEGVTKEQKEELAKKHKAAFQQALADLDDAQKKLETALKDADAVADAEGKAALEVLRGKLKEGQDEFEVLTKRQT